MSETGKLKENKRFYGFTDFRGKPARRGRGRHGPANQVTAGRPEIVPGWVTGGPIKGVCMREQESV